ncbi:hypothetical protein [Clostridium beijerinckii]|uniref:hypothetical protein n=1 Tax=Clostridium beijerinckii TaxID=1520 RepID=UPI001864B3F5|nr:hypothetical protein [Clostridium beijerinckii]
MSCSFCYYEIDDSERENKLDMHIQKYIKVIAKESFERFKIPRNRMKEIVCLKENNNE